MTGWVERALRPGAAGSNVRKTAFYPDAVNALLTADVLECGNHATANTSLAQSRENLYVVEIHEPFAGEAWKAIRNQVGDRNFLSHCRQDYVALVVEQLGKPFRRDRRFR